MRRRVVKQSARVKVIPFENVRPVCTVERVNDELRGIELVTEGAIVRYRPDLGDRPEEIRSAVQAIRAKGAASVRVVSTGTGGQTEVAMAATEAPTVLSFDAAVEAALNSVKGVDVAELRREVSTVMESVR
jgi:hypothetical protein